MIFKCSWLWLFWWEEVNSRQKDQNEKKSWQRDCHNYSIVSMLVVFSKRKLGNKVVKYNILCLFLKQILREVITFLEASFFPYLTELPRMLHHPYPRDTTLMHSTFITFPCTNTSLCADIKYSIYAYCLGSTSTEAMENNWFFCSITRFKCELWTSDYQFKTTCSTVT